MDSERCRILREGPLDVKFPPDSPERVIHKAWRKLWACATVLYPPGRGEPHLVLQLMRGSQEKQLQSVKASRDGLRLFRCRSGSRPLRTWALFSGSTVLVYLAAENEQETQTWMQSIRDGLWPPIYNLVGDIHDVSLIDDEKTFSSGILGLYGRLVRTSDGMVSIIHPHWQGMLLRWKEEDVANIRLIRKVGGEASTAGVFKITLRSSKIEGRTLHFYSNTAVSAITWIRSKATDPERLAITKDLQTKQSLHPSVQFDTQLPSSKSEYAVIRKNSKPPDAIQEKKSMNAGDETLDKRPLETLNVEKILLKNISTDFLDASISSIRPPRKESEEEKSEIKLSVNGDSDSDDSFGDMYEHVYEDLPSRSTSIGAYTLYEEINDSESEYVPPLPPQLPNRPIQKPSSLRLMKLSESVAEALKLAEECPVLVEQQRPGFLKKVIAKKSKSLRSSPLRETVPQNFGEKVVLKRTSSEPDVTNSSLCRDVWPSEPQDNHKTRDVQNNTHYMKSGVSAGYALLRNASQPTQKLNVEFKIGENLKINGRHIPSINVHNEVNVAKNTTAITKGNESDYIAMR